MKEPQQGSTSSGFGGSASALGQETCPACGLPVTQGYTCTHECQSQKLCPVQQSPAQSTPFLHHVPSPVLHPFQGTEARSRPLGLTIDEAKAGAVQVIVLQVVIPGTTVSASQHLLPACHSSDKREVIAPTLPAQNSLGLEDRQMCQPLPYLLFTLL